MQAMQHGSERSVCDGVTSITCYVIISLGGKKKFCAKCRYMYIRLSIYNY